jgi:hypothetical protein
MNILLAGGGGGVWYFGSLFVVRLSFGKDAQIHLNPHQNDQGRKGPCFFQRLIALECLKCQKIKKIYNPPLGSNLVNEPNFWLIKWAFLYDFDNIKKVTKKQGWFWPWLFCMWGINVTNTRIFCVLCHPACGGVIPVSPLSPRHPKMWPRDGPTSPSPEMGRRGGGGRTGKSAHVEWRREQKVLAVKQ